MAVDRVASDPHQQASRVAGPGPVPGPQRLATIEDYRIRARQQIAQPVWRMLFGDDQEPGWESNTSNVEGLRAINLRPRVLVDVSHRRLSTTVLGQGISLPVMIAPCGAHRRFHNDGELATARATARAQTIMALSTISTRSLEEVAAAAPERLWFQLYFLRDRRVTERLVHRAEEAGVKALVVTVDQPGVVSADRTRLPTRERAFTGDGALRNFDDEQLQGSSLPTPSSIHEHVEDSLTWSDLEWLRTVTSLPLVVKGIQTREDAMLCVEHGLDALVVSNHGGFALRGTRPTIETLREVSAVSGDVEVYVDGGVRTGPDVLKALALGARAVLIGRASLWGLAVGGEAGVTDVLEILRQELDDAMRFCGVVDAANVDRSLATDLER